MGLSISTVNAKIGIQRTPLKLEMQTKAPKLELQSDRPMVNIHTELPKVLIDQSKAFASAGRKGIEEFAKEAADLGYQAAMDYISKMSSDGDTLAAIENGGNPIVDIAIRETNTEHEFGMVTMPSVGPEITVTGSVEFDPERTSEGVNNGVEGKYIPGEVNINFTPGEVRTYMERYASINIKYVESKLDVSV